LEKPQELYYQNHIYFSIFKIAAHDLKNTVSSTGINAHGDDKVHAKKLASDRRKNENQTSISTQVGFEERSVMSK